MKFFIVIILHRCEYYMYYFCKKIIYNAIWDVCM
jgi:hypothetical protein